MPMVIARNNDEQFPRMGNDNNIFERLAEYIDVFDPTWKERIKPASQEQIEELRNVTQLKKYAADFPKPYLIFLETMGMNDGELLSEYLLGTANIEQMIHLYYDNQKYTPEVFDTPYLTFFDQETGVEYSFDLSRKYSDNILETDVGEVAGVISENFEKLLFQAAFHQFEIFEYKINFSASEYSMREAKKKYQIKELFEEVEKIGERNALKKAWFSDEMYEIMLGENLSIGVRKTEGGGGYGVVTGEEAEIVEQVVNEIVDIMGARITKSNLP